MRTATQAVLFDFDSTLRDSRQRHHLSPTNNPDNPAITWDTYSEAGINDAPIIGSIALTHMLYPHYQIHIVSGSSSSARDLSLEWLAKHSVTFDFLKLRDDTTENATFKLNYIAQLKAKGTEVVLFVEDWPPVGRKIEGETGIPTLLVNPAYACKVCGYDVLTGVGAPADNPNIRPL